MSKLTFHNTVVVLASGPSMSQSLADKARQYFETIAVNNTIFLAPKSRTLVAQDKQWWNYYRDAVAAIHYDRDVYATIRSAQHPYKRRVPSAYIAGEIVKKTRARTPNSGALALYVAASLNYQNIIMLGFDMHGDHYFGRYPENTKMRNITDDNMQNRRKMMFDEFRNVKELIHTRYPKVRIFNATEGSALDMFEKVDFDSLIDMYTK